MLRALPTQECESVFISLLESFRNKPLVEGVLPIRRSLDMIPDTRDVKCTQGEQDILRDVLHRLERIRMCSEKF